MPIRISNLRLSVEEPESDLGPQIARVLQLPAASVRYWRILRKSLDARDKDAFQFVYTVELKLSADEARIVALAKRTAHPQARVEEYAEPRFELPRPGNRLMRHRPVVIGSGPAGLA